MKAYVWKQPGGWDGSVGENVKQDVDVLAAVFAQILAAETGSGQETFGSGARNVARD